MYLFIIMLLCTICTVLDLSKSCIKICTNFSAFHLKLNKVSNYDMDIITHV